MHLAGPTSGRHAVGFSHEATASRLPVLRSDRPCQRHRVPVRLFIRPDSTDSEGVTEPATVEWFLQQSAGSFHLVQRHESSSLIPWCRDSRFSSRHKDRGNGVEAVMNFCSSCVTRCPATLQLLLTGLEQLPVRRIRPHRCSYEINSIC